VELKSRTDKRPFSSTEAEYEMPSTGNMDAKPIEADSVQLQANPAYKVTNYNRP